MESPENPCKQQIAEFIGAALNDNYSRFVLNYRATSPHDLTTCPSLSFDFEKEILPLTF